MNKDIEARGAFFRRSSLTEGIAEVGLAVAAAAFTAAIWLSIGGWAIEPGRVDAAAVSSGPAVARHVTLPTVVVVGRRDGLDIMPVTTTAQNTAANPITLR